MQQTRQTPLNYQLRLWIRKGWVIFGIIILYHISLLGLGVLVGSPLGPIALSFGIFLGLLALVSSLKVMIGLGMMSIWILAFSLVSLVLQGIPGILAIALTLISFFLLAFFVLAPENRFFTFVSEGTAKAVVRSEKFHRILFQWEDHTIDEEGNIVEVSEQNPPLSNWQMLRMGRLFGGFYFYGFHPVDDIYIYDFEWWGLKPDGTVEYHPRETLDYILLKEEVYFTKVEKAEDYDRLPLDVSLIMRIRVVNPYKALFRIDNWLEAVINRIKPAVRDRITRERFDQLIRKQEAIGREIYENIREIIEGFQRDYGVLVLAVEVINIDPPPEQREATLKEFLAKQERKRIEIEATAESNRIKKVYGRIQEFDELGKLVRVLEALEKSPAQGAKWVILPGISDLLSKALGVSLPPQFTLTPEEIRALKDFIKKLQKETSSPGS